MPFDDNGVEWAFFVASGNFSQRGFISAIIECNSSNEVGWIGLSARVNNYGDELTTAISNSFNQSMWFLMVLFVLGLIGIFYNKNYIAKFTCYWFCHIIFIVGTFSVWQFNSGYELVSTGLSGVYKIMFYFSRCMFLAYL